MILLSLINCITTIYNNVSIIRLYLVTLKTRLVKGSFPVAYEHRRRPVLTLRCSYGIDDLMLLFIASTRSQRYIVLQVNNALTGNIGTTPHSNRTYTFNIVF